MENFEQYLRPTYYIDSDDPTVAAQARELTKDIQTESERLARIYHFVRDIPYDIVAAFRYMSQGEMQASHVLEHGVAMCMGKATLFAALCRAARVPSRIGFQQLDAPDKVFFPPEMQRLWGQRKFPWHSLGEAYLDGHWLKLDATIAEQAAQEQGRPYVRDFDGVHDIPSVEGKIVAQLDSYADYPGDVAEWYREMAIEVSAALGTPGEGALAADEALWKGP